MSRSDVRQFRVVPVSLDGPGRREILPMLVDRNTGVPPRLPLRWAVRRRRWECMPNTLASNLRALGLLYEWGARMHGSNVDTLLEHGLLLDGAEIEALIAYLRSRALDEELHLNVVTEAPTLHTLANVAWPIREFLKWVADPQARGGRGTIDPRDLAVYRLRLDFGFQPAVRRSGTSARIQPLTTAQDVRVRELVGVLTGSAGRGSNPFVSIPPTRLRRRHVCATG